MAGDKSISKKKLVAWVPMRRSEKLRSHIEKIEVGNMGANIGPQIHILVIVVTSASTKFYFENF